MNPDHLLRINDILPQDNGHRIGAELEMGEQKWPVYYHSDDIQLTPNLEAFIALTLVAAMRHRQFIQAQGEISVRFLENLAAVQDFFLKWKPHYARVEIRGVTPVRRPASAGGRVGVFFSAGLDSFYTFLKHEQEISDLIFIHGSDIPLDRHTLRAQAAKSVHHVADYYAKRVVEIESNATSFRLANVPSHQDFGAFMTSVGHLLYPSFSRIYIASGHTYDIVSIMEGSHPALDPLWGTEALEFVHDGLEAGRLDKAALVATSEVAMRTLRVCVENRGGAYNCGVCPKCLRTMMNLRIVGALERCTTFERPLDLKRVARIRPHGNKRVFLEEILVELQKSRADPVLEAAVRKALKGRPVVDRAFNLVEKLRFKGARRKRFQKS
jgi:hypothetical protein